MTGNCNVEFATLIDYIEGKVDREECAQLEAHLATGCPLCQRSLTWLRRTIHLMKTDASVAPSGWVNERAKGLFKEHRAEPSTQPSRAAAFLMLDGDL